jgi:hypothetical protein
VSENFVSHKGQGACLFERVKEPQDASDVCLKSESCTAGLVAAGVASAARLVLAVEPIFERGGPIDCRSRTCICTNSQLCIAHLCRRGGLL